MVLDATKSSDGQGRFHVKSQRTAAIGTVCHQNKELNEWDVLLCSSSKLPDSGHSARSFVLNEPASAHLALASSEGK